MTKTFKVWLAVLAVVILAGGLVLTNLDKITGKQSGAHATASSTCRDAVKLRLRAPATAKFHDEQITNGNDQIRVSGQVDSQNGFGALLTSTYSCTTTANGIFILGKASVT